MGSWLTLHTVIAFILGVLLAAYVKSLIAGLKSKAAGAA